MIKLQILQNPNKKYFGEMWVDKHLVFQGIPMTSEIIAIRNLNKAIDRYNSQKGLVGKRAIPHYPEIEGHNPIVIEQAKKVGLKVTIIEAEQVEQIAPTEQVEIETAPTEQVEPKPKPSQPKRKPFTPYGLKGYLVDKNGNVRLMLDRRANANTIVLEPQMFGALAEMVKKTQEQQNVR
ncbi:hypothetical protein Q7Z55_10750 [Glaesserella parasuis]|uniref:hypothetical protein n=1 Tax=Glaesserella parasuis TaxID=738 RepID=UPI0003AC48F0|nr:hypothetical protein [Glaesserella parasuis]ATW45492.1 hypothetical protein A2U21_05885 [Glaesserella parasuis str. Nagasaki]EQA03274.1 hypothetical protein HPSNAG_0540 [Glaesserella parasuis str. Nagasaki]MDP0070030.1 hypothetical protein [Glaesserella parasuis]MDP0245936.1 hypothetical protein [Glaesserella parasuis]MDP0280138.1 hypothetical protein [Glaesserella parasuis]